jgi:D-alanine-D-alanine ligase
VTRIKRLRVGVVYGGRSSEHEVSLASAAAVFANLDRQRYEPIAIRIEKDGRWVLPDRPPSAASAADVIDQQRNDQARNDGMRVRGGREVFLPPRPGDDTLVLVDRRSGREGEAEAAAAVTDHSGKTARFRVCWSWPTWPTSAAACWRRPWAWTRRS